MAIPVRILDPGFSVSAQLAVGDIPSVAGQGFASLINNRPDGEGGQGQPVSRDIAEAARAAGLHYVHLPVVAGAITPVQAAAMRDALAAAPRPVLAFCRSGARSAQLYALAQAAGPVPSSNPGTGA